MTASMTRVNAQDYAKMPRGSQMLIAYALVNDQSQLQLLETDRDARPLLLAGWLVEKLGPVQVHGCHFVEFPDEVWSDLLGIADEILSSMTEDEFERFKARKNKAYPWNW